MKRLIVATPLLLTVAVPMGDPPLSKVIPPAVAGVPSEDTVAVKVMPRPKTALVEEDAREVVVVGRVTMTMTGFEADVT